MELFLFSVAAVREFLDSELSMGSNSTGSIYG